MENKQGILDKIRALKGKKGLDTILIIVVIAAIALIYFTSYSAPAGEQEKEAAAEANAPAATPGTDLEEKLEKALSSIRGAGAVRVLITYESSAELVPAMNTETQTNEETGSDDGSTTSSQTTRSEMATVQNDGDSEAVVLRENEPMVRGVVVVAQGASDVAVRMQLAQAVCTVLDIEQSKVEVFEME